MAITEKKARSAKRPLAFKPQALPFRLAADYANLRFLRPRRSRPKLQALCLYVTYQCNFRCTMCGIWKRKEHGPELTPADLEHILGDPLFAGLEFININGGEPNLRPDLPEITAMLARKFPRLRAISLNTNGQPTDRTVTNAEAMARTCRDNGIAFSISVSLHGLKKIHDDAVGVKGAFPKVVRTLERLKDLKKTVPFFLGVNCVIARANAAHLDEFHAWCASNNLPVNYTLGEVRDRFNNRAMATSIRVTGDELRRVVAFLRGRAAERSLRNQHALRYQELADMLEHDAPRSLSCHYALGGAIVGARGQLYYCKQSAQIGDCRKGSAAEAYFAAANQQYRRRDILEGLCPVCPPNTFNRFELGHDLFRYVRFLAKRSGASSRT
jgi:MoaA/NifB/PqqE/SkfB family radical SAM enzyme